MNEAFWGFVAATVIVVVSVIAYDLGEKFAHDDVRDQCERQQSVRLGKKAFFYCSREPVKK